MTRSVKFLPFLSLLLVPLVTNAQSQSTTQSTSQSRYSVGESQLCVLQDDGAPNCIITGGFERLLPPENLPELSAVTSGDSHSCGISTEGDAICWGDNNFGQLNAPATALPLTQINAGHNHTCALDTEGSAHCWGLNSNRQTEPPEGAVFSKVHAAFTSSCGILENGEITCWSTDRERAPDDLTGTFIDLDMQSQGVCGLTTTGEIRCNELIGFLVPPLTNGPYIDLATVRGVLCGLNTNNELECNINEIDPFNSPDLAEFPIGEQFLSIQSAETGFSGIGSSRESRPIGTTLCGERLDGSLQCWSPSRLFPDIDNPNVTPEEAVTDMRLDMDARIYGPSSVEIFYTPLSFEARNAEVEIFRNGELLDRVNARQSYFDGNALSTNTYQIRLVDDSGNIGAFSQELFVDTANRTVLFNGEPPVSESRQNAFGSQGIFTDFSGTASANGTISFWTIDQSQQSLIDGYEIELNGPRAGFTRSQLYVNLEERVTSCIRISAIGFDGLVLDRVSRGAGCN